MTSESDFFDSLQQMDMARQQQVEQQAQQFNQQLYPQPPPRKRKPKKKSNPKNTSNSFQGIPPHLLQQFMQQFEQKRPKPSEKVDLAYAVQRNLQVWNKLVTISIVGIVGCVVILIAGAIGGLMGLGLTSTIFVCVFALQFVMAKRKIVESQQKFGVYAPPTQMEKMMQGFAQMNQQPQQQDWRREF